MPKAIIVKPGDPFGRLRVIQEVPPKSSRGQRRFKCRCICPLETILEVDLCHLKTEHTSSCGCLQREQTSKVRFIHGQRHSVEFETISRMIQRCHNPNNPNFKDYGGRGITVYLEWRESPAAFMAYIGKRPGPGYTIERIRNNEGYFPGNVKWATRAEQGRNKRNNVWIEHEGQRRLLIEVCEEKSISFSLVNGRRKRGCPDSELFKSVNIYQKCIAKKS